MGISNNYWRDYWGNIGGNYWIIALGENRKTEKLKYIKYKRGITNKPSIDALCGFEDQEGFLLD